MIDGWVIITAALAYIGCLFGVAWLGDWRRRSGTSWRGRPVIYSLTLAVYCTSWTFFGSVGLAATSGFDFLPVYIGAILMIAIGWPLLQRIARLAKSQNTTSIADFIAARYGKSPAVAAIVAIIAVAGTLPYIALQLKAVSTSVTTLLAPPGLPQDGAASASASSLPLGDIAFAVSMLMAAFAVLFGTRHVDATEHQEGLMLAIATESIVKIVAFLAVGIFVTFFMFGGLSDLFERVQARPDIVALFSRGFHGGKWLTITFLSLVCIILLPRQFHVAVVENNSEREIRTAAWLFPLYLVVINLFVVPIAMAGLLAFPSGGVPADMFVMALPMSVGANVMTMIAFLGGLSAATAMVIVATVALAIMICNDLVVPLILRHKVQSGVDMSGKGDGMEEMAPLFLNIRRFAIFAVLALAYAFHRMLAGPYMLASLGLLAFSAIAQFAPAFFGGLIWRRATARGAIAGILAGFSVWAYTLLLPWFVKAGLMPTTLLEHGPLGISFLRPQILFNLEFEPLTHGVVWSLFANILAYVTVSLLRAPQPIERLQANVFVSDEFARPTAPAFRLWRTSVSVEDLMRTAARYVGAERAERSFKEYFATRDVPFQPHAEADVQAMRFTEHLLASSIGAPSSRLVLSLLLRRHNVGHQSALKLLDDASEALHYNRDLLQSALDHVSQGISVFDKDMRLICWNRQFRELLDLPVDLGRVGVPLDVIVRYCVERSDVPPARLEQTISERLHKLTKAGEAYQERLPGSERVLEVRTTTMPQGGIVTTYTDITERVRAAEALARANETLERRVRERTSELTHVNRALAEAKAKADEANLDKTRFLAAASHDILQPLNAARLYTTSLVERMQDGSEAKLVRNIDASLEAVEEILGALIDISRLDAGALSPDVTSLAIGEIFEQLEVEFAPLAQEAGLDFRIVPTSATVRSDRRLLRRVLQNLVSNAIKYTEKGRVVLGCRRRNGEIVVQVADTGPGIPRGKQALVFKEFQRLQNNLNGAHGLGLGLSIVQRICRVLDHPIAITSEPGKGTIFSVTLPLAQAVEVPRRSEKRASAGDHVTGCIALCIDNEVSILDSMETLLSSWGCRVYKARSTPEAVDLVRRGVVEPEVILADYHLDDGTGLEAIDAVCNEVGHDITAIVITADHTPEVQGDVRQKGLQLLRKPLKPAALRAVMAQARLQRAAAE